MTPTAVRLLAATTVIAAACIDPTDACGCSPPPPSVVVRGRVLDAADAPVAQARVVVDGVPGTISLDPPMFINVSATTDANGAFVTRAYSRYGSGEMTLRAAVVRAGTTDTVRVRLGTNARFGGAPDTVDVTVRLR